MALSSLRVRDVENRWDSLSLAMHALLDWAGLDLHYRAYSGALGHSFMTTASARDDDCLGSWSAYGRDARLIEAARLFGVRLREVHPPDAAKGLADAAEFAQHFEASYRPIVKEALQNGQPVLAWQGWPEPRQYFWGVITETTPEGIGLAGTTMWCHGQSAPLLQPPVQLYVVEEVYPTRPDHQTLLSFSIESARRALHNKLADQAGTLSGAPAYDRWEQRLQSDPVCPTCGGQSANCHHQMARFVTYARRSAVRLFDHYRDGLGSEFQPLLDAALAHCRAVIEALGTSRDEAAVKTLIHTAEGRDALRSGVGKAKEADEALAGVLDELHTRISVD